MPKRMLLRSHWWCTNLSDPRREFGLERFCTESQNSKNYPLPLEVFVDYGLWFQQRAVPDLDQTFVSTIDRQDGEFHVRLADGREVRSRAVVMATGPRPYANRLPEFAGLADGLVSHSCDHSDFTRFKERDVVVIGGGQSAIEYAALLNEAGARVQVIARRRILWLDRDRSDERTRFERIKAPDAAVGPGWRNWVLDHVPYLFYKFPQEWKDSYNSNYESGATYWLRDRIFGKVSLHENRTVTKCEGIGGKINLTLSDGQSLSVDHVLLATGYKVDVSKLTMLDAGLRALIQTDRAIPVLSGRFESSVPGLYFVGITSLRAFGPLYRFVAGCGAAARRVAGDIARNRVGTSVRSRGRRTGEVALATSTAPLPQ
jgi:cation diffusion facilitator CzcD-associated flavoprotein CzcO